MEHDNPRVSVPAIVGVLWRPLDDFNGYGLTRSGYLYWKVQRLNQETATFMWMYECEGTLIFPSSVESKLNDKSVGRVLNRHFGVRG